MGGCGGGDAKTIISPNYSFGDIINNYHNGLFAIYKKTILTQNHCQ